VEPVKRRRRSQGRSESGAYLALPHAVMNSANFQELSGKATKLLLELGRQYRGTNNGDLSAAWAILKPRGWKSRTTIEEAVAELIKHGLIEKTRQGGRNACNLYALTWKPIDQCDGKLDVSPTNVSSNLWRGANEG